MININYLLLFVTICLINYNVKSVYGACFFKYERQCDNGDCILESKWCDGIRHCADGSDETIQDCKNKRCEPGYFRCSYGACISNTLKCNGVWNCRDGSDETPFECSGLNINGNCGPFQVQCNDNEQCISQADACDGKKDCRDGSDETVKSCSELKCDNFYFQCKYGPCIRKSFKCNGIIDCADSSDEMDCPVKPDNITSYSTDNEFDDSVLDGCYIPSKDNLIIINTGTRKILQPGYVAQLLTSIKYSCPKDYVLVGSHDTNFCSGNWVNKHPKCIKLCPPIKGHTIRALCSHKNAGISCKRSVPPGTIAKISCADVYKKPNNQVYDDLTCLDGGTWNYQHYTCEQICGTVNTIIPNSVGGKITQVQKVPWHVGIYMRDMRGHYNHVCGGTLIQSKIVVTAAHCFWNLSTSELIDRSEFVVAVGKFYRDFYANEKESVQFSNISKLKVPLIFNGHNYDYAQDIAVLTLNDHIEFNNHVRPACLTWYGNNDKVIPDDSLGIVAGWGIKDENRTYSSELRSVELLAVNIAKCRQRLKGAGIANDKFCVETGFGSNVCEGDSGGGYVVQTKINGIPYYYLWGVVSNGISNLKEQIPVCDSQFLTTFTNVQYYEDIIKEAQSNQNL